jgi:hypothetical protein
MLGIVILNYNTWIDTIECIKSIYRNLKGETCKIYVVDNDSSQKPLPSIMDYIHRLDNIQLIVASSNRGYSAGNNIGIKQAMLDGCDYILISNSDILFVDNSILIMRDYLASNNEVGIVGPQVYNIAGDFQPFYMLSKLTVIGKLKNMFLQTPLSFFFKEFKKKYICDLEISKPQQVFGVSGCCFMMSRACAEYLYPLDERTFLYEEEYIIGVRMEKSFMQVHIIPNTHIIHAHGNSTGGMTYFTYNCMVKSEQLYLREYLHCSKLTCLLMLCLRKILQIKYIKL